MTRRVSGLLLFAWACSGAAVALPNCPAVGYYHQCVGQETWPSGNRYAGEFKNNKKHGQGTYTVSNGDQYMGEFKDGTFNGQGTYTFAKGGRYAGDFKDGKRTGEGVFTSADGSTIVGEWRDDLPHGRALEFAADGTFARSGLYGRGHLISPQVLTLDNFPRLSKDPVVRAIVQAQASRQATDEARVAAAAAEKLATQLAQAQAQRQAEEARMAAEAAQAAEAAEAAEKLALQRAQAEAQRQAEEARAAAEAAEKQAAEQAQPATETVSKPAGVSTATLAIKDCAECPDMVLLPSGSLLMKLDKASNPQSAVTVNVRSFAIGKTEVTQRQWKSIMGDNPSRFVACGPDCPVENVSWKDIAQFIRKLNQKTGQSYRLPSESEWEYAARGGSATDVLFANGAAGLEDQAWFIANSRKTPRPVASKKPNAFGLHDLYGNVWEWVEDCFHETYAGLPLDGSAWIAACSSSHRVLRGGSWTDEASSLRNRGHYAPDIRNLITGFRLARTAP